MADLRTEIAPEPKPGCETGSRSAPAPWLVIIGVGEDGMAGLSATRHAELDRAAVIFGGPRHLALVNAGERGRPWPVPFSVAPVLAERGRAVVVLASGDPFWFGAGASLAERLDPDEWIAHPAPSTFSLAASSLGWSLEKTSCFGLHAAPFERLLPALSDGARAICLMRDGPAVVALAGWLSERGFGASTLHVMEALGGARERIRSACAESFSLANIATPVAAAIEFVGRSGLARASGLPDECFSHDGQITKRPVRALTLSALAPRPGELLWDIGAGSGSISIEWCLSGGRAVAIETRMDRAATIQANAREFGVDHLLHVVDGPAPAAFANLPEPNAAFIGGGADEVLLTALWERLPVGARIVANAVTLETEALLTLWHGRKGGELLRIELSVAAPLGSMRGWRPARPVTQWSVTR
ncbi:precorrin-6y C5,15-methyltransferase (decarboxylating) subunit CbiE [Acetobacter nitrogenifigens]|uniref:precorrin-6y C5,15-methyltransferase (decarboxylating) subunit CbiE n=1 Tax=Acetobacter nitrogenifigens TaxID=285268 RepID=UPI000A011394|nr:precorrin-6y C5,15-methyltransferase (decarboxylating) subunit CbiE [Acetobacter nitrogenifigens]